MIFKSDIPEKLTKYGSAHFVVVPVPYEQTTSYGRGTKNGPRAICEASAQVELFDEELQKETYHRGIHTLPVLKPSLEELEKTAAKILADKKFPIVLGGEHTISAACVRACKKFYKNLSVVQFDAHADLRDEYEGTRLSHACVMRRVYETGAKFVQIGIRSHSIEEAEFISKSKINKPFYAHEIFSSNDWAGEAINLLTDDVYLTFDVDALDPSIVPATGTPEPGGLGWHQTVNFLKKLCASKNVVGADFVELAPKKGEPLSDFTIAKLIYKLIGYLS